MSLVILGLGNDVLADDSVGLRLVRHLQGQLGTPPPCALRESTGGGLALLDELAGFDRALVIDAVLTRAAPPGTAFICRDRPEPRVTLGSAHTLGIAETLALGRELGIPLPYDIVVFAVEVEDPFTLREALSPALRRAMPRLQRDCLDLARRMLHGSCNTTVTPRPPASPQFHDTSLKAGRSLP